MKSGYRLAAAALAISAVFPCAVDTSPSFVPRRHPEKFDTTFLRGQLGIISPGLLPKYKLIAWRYLSGIPLDQDEQEAIATTVPLGNASAPALEQWRTAQSVGGALNPPYVYTGKSSRLDPNVYYDNCLPDAFSVAAGTLYDRRDTYANPEMLRAWMLAQSQVFQNCTSNKPVYPDAPLPSLTPLARADREYQIAAAHFYAEDLEGAERLFRAISTDNSSPWRETSHYMVARTLIRKAALLHRPEALLQANALLHGIESGPFYDSAQRLITYINTLSDPLNALKTLGGEFAAPHAGAAISDRLGEAAFALTSARFQDVLTKPGLPEPFDWIGALDSGATDDSVRRWRSTRSALWLVAALINAKPEDEANAELIDAALKVPENSPAFDTVAFNSVRLLIGSGQTSVARRRLNTLLLKPHRNLNSVDNAYREQRMSLATNFDDFLRWAPRRPIGIADDDGYNRSTDDTPILGYDSVQALNSLTPLPKLMEAAASTRLPQGSRAQLAISAWTRAFILGNDAAAGSLSDAIAKAHPAWASDLEAFRTSVGDQQRFTGALLVSRHADFHPSVAIAFAPDWWCAELPRADPGDSLPKGALTPNERLQAKNELQRIHDAGPAQSVLAPIVMSWAKTHPEDPRVPESLHRLVRITRYGCRGTDGNGKISKAAFDLLHQRYPSSEWARRTPYWFDK